MEKKTFKSVKRCGVFYMFDAKDKALVELTMLCEVFHLKDGSSVQAWRIADTDRQISTVYRPATEDEPESFSGNFYHTLEDFEKGKPMAISDIFCNYDEKDVCSELAKPYGFCTSMDDKGAYFWTIENGEAVKWYFHDHMSNVVVSRDKDGTESYHCNYEKPIPEAFRCSDDVYKYNDYRFIDKDGKETVRKGLYKRLALTVEQKALVDKVQEAIDACTKAGVCVYFDTCDYMLRAINVPDGVRIEYDPVVDEETEDAYDFDDSRVAYTFNNVTDYSTDNPDVKLVVKKQAE